MEKQRNPRIRHFQILHTEMVQQKADDLEGLYVNLLMINYIPAMKTLI